MLRAARRPCQTTTFVDARGTHPVSPPLPIARSGDPSRAGRPCRSRRLSALGTALPAAARRAGHGRRRDAPARRLLAPLPGAPRRRRGIRLLRHRLALSQQRRRHAARARAARRRGDGRPPARARLPHRRPARQLGRRIALRLLPPAIVDGPRGSPPSCAVRRCGAAARDRPAGRRRVHPPGRASRRGPLPPRPPRPVAGRRVGSRRDRPAARHVRPAQRLPAHAARAVVVCRVVPPGVPRRAAGALPAVGRARARVVRGGALEPPAPGRPGGRRADAGRRACPPGPAGAPAPLLPDLPDARRSAIPRSEARSVAAAAGLDLLLRSRSGRRQLRRGPGPGDERAWMALHVVRSHVERRARAHAAWRHGSDPRRLRARRHGHLPERMPPQPGCLGAQDKQWAELPWAGHYLYPVGPAGAELPHPQDRVADETILPWLRQRWPV